MLLCMCLDPAQCCGYSQVQPHADSLPGVLPSLPRLGGGVECPTGESQVCLFVGWLIA